MATRLCGCVCWSGMFLMRYTHRDGSARVSLRNLDAIPSPSSLSTPPAILSKLLDPSEQQHSGA